MCLEPKLAQIGKVEYSILEASETKLLSDWKRLMVMLCYIHQTQQTNTYSRSTKEIPEEGMKCVQSRRQYVDCPAIVRGGGGSSQRGKCFNYNLGLIFLDVHSVSRGMGCFNSCIVKI